MPELPDIAAYLEALHPRIQGSLLQRVRLGSPFLLRTIAPPLSTAEGKTVVQLDRVGKRIAIGLENDVWLVLHLMIAGRLHWRKAGAGLSSRQNLAAFDFEDGSLVFTEAGTRHRASLHVVSGVDGLKSLDPGGIDVFESSFEKFAGRLTSANHTLKRALTDPRLFSGIGNAYSDEILHSARLSPIAMTAKLTVEEQRRLWESTRSTLRMWIDRLCAEAREKFPEKVTAFRTDMAVHGRFGLPCLVCGAKIQRIRYADNETNYCAKCQTSGRLLADRALSRLLREDWPKSLDELDQ
jgi:formamidopyrimidine-DNA glycosylase